MDRGSLEQLLERGLSLAEIGRQVGRHESTVAYWADQHGLRAANREKHAARGGLSRATLELLIEEGASIAEIAATLDRSEATVRHWLREYDLKTQRAARRLAYDGQATGGERPRQVTATCSRHGVTTFQMRVEGGYRCLKCRSEAVARRRRKVKQMLVAEAGGRCRLCGYDRYVGALEFHHREPADKRFALSHRGVARSLVRARAEAEKCVLLCANCHAEVEGGIRALE